MADRVRCFLHSRYGKYHSFRFWSSLLIENQVFRNHDGHKL